MFRVLLVCAFLAGACTAEAAPLPVYGPPPAWVKPVPIPKASAAADGAAVQLLLQDSQDWFGPDADEDYSETAMKILASQGLSAVGNVVLNWNPDTETVTVHRINIIRGDKVIDVLAGGKTLTVLRRESNLELSMLDGTLTATIQPEDLRVGDILDLAVTRRRHDPVLQGRSEAFAALSRPGAIGRFHVRTFWAPGKPIRWRATEGMGDPIVVHAPDRTELVFDATDARAPTPPKGAPARFSDVATLQFSQFANWSEMSALMAPLYSKAASLSANSPLRADVARIRAASADPNMRASAALKLVQDQTRYVFLGMNFGGYIPADADVTWTRRFGDCKGKTALLLALLRELGIEAAPALVSSTLGDGLDERLPMLGLFDHVLVRATIGGRIYWLDGTRQGDRNIDSVPPPEFRWALPLTNPGSGLEKMEQPPFELPQLAEQVRIDASAGIDAPAPAHLEYVYRGDTAIGVHVYYGSLDRAEAERSEREYWARSYPWITSDKVGFDWDESQGVLRFWMDGAAKMDWSKNKGVRDFSIGESNLGWNANFVREPGAHKDAPYAVDHPDFKTWSVAVTLPDHGGGFTLLSDDDVDKVIAGVAYKRKTRMEDGVVRMRASQRSLQREFPASEAADAAQSLRDLWRYDVAIRSEQTGPPATSATAPTAPTDAAGFSGRGVTFLLHGEFAAAIADFSAAAKLEPNVSRHLYNRGVAHHAKGEDELALADFDRALQLNAEDSLALTSRAELQLAAGHEAQAQKDFDQAITMSHRSPSVLARRAEAYDHVRRFETALTYYDELIRLYPASDKMDRFLASRCWIVAKWGRQLERGLADCDAALAINPEGAGNFQSRGYVRLRLGKLDQAIADFDDALRRRSDAAPSLYGRGLAELRKGAKARGDADIAAASNLDPKLGAEFLSYGVGP